MRSDNRGRDIFYGVVAIATLIVAIVGATLAYFSVTAQSNEGAVNATSAIVSIEYNDGQQVAAQADKLIPSSLEVVQSVYAANITTLTPESPSEDGACIDDAGREVCSVYRFTVRSDVPRTVSATLNNEYNGFNYLSYAVYNVTTGTWITLTDAQDLSLTQCSNNDEDTENDCFKMNGTQKIYDSQRAVNSIFGKNAENEFNTVQVGGTTQIYDLVLFIKENNENQNADQGQQYNGTIIVEVTDGGLTGNGQITGCVGDDCE